MLGLIWTHNSKMLLPFTFIILYCHAILINRKKHANGKAIRMSQNAVDEYAEYLRGISFAFLQPHHPIPRGVGFRTITRYISHLTGWSLEYKNTRLPDKGRNTAELLYPLCKIPKLSSLTIGAVINQGVFLMALEHDYVNVGVWNGFSFLAALVANEDKVCIGVDNFSEYGGPEAEFLKRYEKLKTPKSRFYNMDYREFLQNHYQGTMGIYFFDGPHGYRDQFDALKLAEPFFSDDCIVIVDDTNWDQPRQATQDFIRGSHHRYELLLDVKTRCSYHPTFWNGVMVFRKKDKG